MRDGQEAVHDEIHELIDDVLNKLNMKEEEKQTINLDKVIGNAQAWRDTFREQFPDLAVRFWPNAGELADIEYLAFMHPDFHKLPCAC